MKLAIAMCLVACSSVCPAQAPADLFNSAPPAVDAALRDRIGKFYQAHVDRRLRAADEVVAEDSKDMFFAIEKPRYLSWEIATIVYSDDFTKAKAVVACEIDWANPRMGKMRVKVPITSLWKIVDDQWYWYMEPVKSWETPFGAMKPGPDNPQPAASPGGFKGVRVEDVLAQVKIERSEVQLPGYEPSTAEVAISNRMPGNVTLRLDYGGFAGLEMTLDKTELKPGEQAKLRVRLNPVNRAPKPAVIARIHVEPTNQVIPLKVTFSVPPEIEKQLPKIPRQ